MVLSREQYEYIDESILDTFEAAGICSFPIDVLDLCSKLKIKVRRYSEFPEYLNEYNDDAFRIYNPKKQEFIIVYNDSIESNRVNFSIMHEIGHIQLDHQKRPLIEEIQETEANIFAQKALAPVGVILKLGLKTDIQISNIFNISLPCARVITSSLRYVIQNPMLRQKEINNPITSLFEKEINAYINK